MGDLSKNYSRHEFACPCCGWDDIDLKLMPILEAARHYEGDKPDTPNSGCRCYHHNEIVQMDVNENYTPGSSKSMHMEGKAVDRKSKNPLGLYTFLDQLFPNMYGLICYDTFVHIDTRQNPYRSDKRSV